MVTIDQSQYAANVQEANANVGKARAELAHADNQLTRARYLAANDVNSEVKLEDAEVNYQRAKASLEQAQAALTKAQLQLEDTKITAPFDAGVISESATVGNLINPGAVIAQLYAVDYAEISAGLSKEQLSLLLADGAAGDQWHSLRGKTVDIVARLSKAGKPADTKPHYYQGTITALQPNIEPRARTVNLTVQVNQAFESTDSRPPLLLNDLVTVLIPVAAKPHWWKIPATALKQSNRLWRLSPENTLTPINVVPVSFADEFIIVESSRLNAGDLVLTTDLANPLPGLKVRRETSLTSTQSPPPGAKSAGKAAGE